MPPSRNDMLHMVLNMLQTILAWLLQDLTRNWIHFGSLVTSWLGPRGMRQAMLRALQHWIIKFLGWHQDRNSTEVPEVTVENTATVITVPVTAASKSEAKHCERLGWLCHVWSSWFDRPMERITMDWQVDQTWKTQPTLSECLQAGNQKIRTGRLKGSTFRQGYADSKFRKWYLSRRDTDHLDDWQMRFIAYSIERDGQ